MDAITVLTLARVEPRKVLWFKGGGLIHISCIAPDFQLFDLLYENMPSHLIDQWRDGTVPSLATRCLGCKQAIVVVEHPQTCTLYARAVD